MKNFNQFSSKLTKLFNSGHIFVKAALKCVIRIGIDIAMIFAAIKIYEGSFNADDEMVEIFVDADNEMERFRDANSTAECRLTNPKHDLFFLLATD